MKTILVGVDFSKSSSNTTDFAISLAKRTKSKILLFHAVQTPIVHTNSGMYFVTEDYLGSETKELLEKLQKKLKLENPSLTFETSYSYVGLKAEVKDLIKKNKVHMVVLGHETKSKVEELIYGTTSVDLMGKLDCPIITVPEKYKHHKFDKIAIAVDYKGTIDSHLSRRMHEMTEFIGAKPVYVHVQTEDELLIEKNPNKQIPVEVIPAKDFISGVKKYIKKEEPDMIMVLSRNHNVFYSLFMDSHSKQLVSKSQIPVISLHH